MSRNENYYRYQPLNKPKYTSTISNTMGNVEHRYSTHISNKIDPSKEKENDRAINFDKKSKRTPQPEQSKRVGGDLLSFKGMIQPTHNYKQSEVNNVQQTQERRPKQKKQRQTRQLKRDAKQIERVSSALSINARKQTQQVKPAYLKIEAKHEDPRKLSQKRSSGAAKFKRTKEKEPILSDFMCNEQMQTVQPRSSRAVKTQKSKPTLLKTNIIKPIKQGIEKQIFQFEQKQALINFQQQAEQLLYLGSRQNNYAPNPEYIQKNQKHLTWFMRAILYEWMMHVSFQYKLKRDTFHLAISLSDLFFSKVPHIPKTQLQLVGAAAMYLSAKIQQREPLSVVRFAESTDGKYQSKSILQMQSKLVQKLKWQLNPPTIAMWANKIMQQWDLFIEESDYGRNHPLLKQRHNLFFKKVNQSSLCLFLQVTQLLDTCSIQIQSLQYKQKPLVCSIIYLVLKKEIQGLNVKKIIDEYSRSSNFLLDDDNLFNDLFRAFVQYTFGFLLLDLLPTIQYCSTFFGLTMEFETHGLDIEESASKNYQQFTSYQTYNRNTLQLIKRRQRGIIQGIYGQ